MKWSSELEVGINKIDRQHKAIINIIEQIENIKEVKRESYFKLVKRLLINLISHHEYEEEYITRNYPTNIKDHGRNHRKRIHLVLNLINAKDENNHGFDASFIEVSNMILDDIKDDVDFFKANPKVNT